MILFFNFFIQHSYNRLPKIVCFGFNRVKKRGGSGGEGGPADTQARSRYNRGMDGTRRADVKPGLHVAIVLKHDQRTGKLTEGIVRDILTSSANHPHGIKVRLVSGQIGRVKRILG